MYRLFYLPALLFVLIGAEPRSPKIYNVLISTKKNLSPSHAVPVFEPVLRTTSLGVALPPVFYQSPLGGYQPTTFVADNYVFDQALSNNPSPATAREPSKENGPQDALEGQPEQFIPYHPYTPYVLNGQPYYPQFTQQPQEPQQGPVQSQPQPQIQPQPQAQDQSQPQPQPQFSSQPQFSPQLQPQVQPELRAVPEQQFFGNKPEDPKTIVANLKRNPEIPDVPPPALPVRTKSSN